MDSEAFHSTSNLPIFKYEASYHRYSSHNCYIIRYPSCFCFKGTYILIFMEIFDYGQTSPAQAYIGGIIYIFSLFLYINKYINIILLNVINSFQNINIIRYCKP